MADSADTDLSAAEVMDRLDQLPGILSGAETDPTGIVVEILHDLGNEALACIHESYVAKSWGATGADGISWPDLAPTTKAERTVHDRWKQVFQQSYRVLLGQGLASRDAGAHAAAHAWQAVKVEITPALRQFAAQQVQRLHKTGALELSLTPGSGSPYQIFDVAPEQGMVTVGSDLPYAARQHYGDEAHDIPARPFWPLDGSVPKAWEQRLVPVLERGLSRLIPRLLAG